MLYGDLSCEVERGMGERMLRVSEVAAELKVNPYTVRRWLREGKLRGSDLGGSAGYRVAASEVERFLRERLNQQPAPQS